MFDVSQGQNLFYLLTSIAPKKGGYYDVFCFSQALLWKGEQVLPDANDPEPGESAKECRKLREEVVVKKKDLEALVTRHRDGEVNQGVVPENCSSKTCGHCFHFVTSGPTTSIWEVSRI